MSRPELGRRLSVDPATVWRWEQGKQKPEQPDVPMAIAALFGLDPDEVLVAAGLKVGTEPTPIPEPEFDEELEAVRTDPTLDPEDKIRIVDLIMERRARDRAASLAETRRLIELMRHRRGTAS